MLKVELCDGVLVTDEQSLPPTIGSLKYLSYAMI